MKIKIYTTPTCPWCKKTKEFFKDNDIEYEEKDVSSDKENQKEMKEKSGQLGVPVIDIDGDIIVGFDKEKLKEKLDID